MNPSTWNFSLLLCYIATVSYAWNNTVCSVYVCMSSRSSSLSSDPSVSNMATDKTHEMLEDENERLMSEMARKIDTLKTVRSIKKYLLMQ